MKEMYLDESGDHNLTKIDPDYPYFVLGGVIVDREYQRDVMVVRVKQLKRRFFGRDDIVLHTADIVRARRDLVGLQESDLNAEFLGELTSLMMSLEYTVIACVIDKRRFTAEHGHDGVDIYRRSLDVLVDRFCDEIGDQADGGIVFAETRRPDLDHDLNMAWEHLKETGTEHVQGSTINRRIVDLSLKDKRLNIAGLQLADLVVSPIGRAVMEKPAQADWTVVQSKFRRHAGTHIGAGLIVLPAETDKNERQGTD